METLKLLHPTPNAKRRREFEADSIPLTMPLDGRLEPSTIKAVSPLQHRIDTTFAILSAVARKPKASRKVRKDLAI